MDAIPKLDLHIYSQGSPSDKQQFAADLGRAFREIGFVAVRNHGIAEDDISKMYESVKCFFALPDSVKMKYDDTQGGGQRGYTGFGKEHAKNRNAGDLKEFWHFGQYVDDGDVLANYYPGNREVAELPDFNLYGRRFYKALENTGMQLLRAIALHLELPEGWFDAQVKNGNSILRPIHYPPITAEPQDAIRAGEHEDINLITLLVGASADGLEVMNQDGQYIPVTRVEDHIVVNVGDMLQRLTNDMLRSTTHRVVNPPRERWSEPRFSIPFFMHPRPEMSLACLPQCISETNPKKYADCTANEFLMERLAEIGLIQKGK
jgi:isopenicillin N synthase-like dioxygenase